MSHDAEKRMAAALAKSSLGDTSVSDDSNLLQAIAIASRVLSTSKYDPSNWYTTNRAAEELGVQRNLLESWLADGFLRYGEHYIDIRRPNATRTKLRWNVPALIEWFAKNPPESRA